MEIYPTDKEIMKIENWGQDHKALMNYIKGLWRYSDDFAYWQQEHNGEYRISTGGWSGNEEIISAMTKNTMFWMVCWYQSRRGGHYVFKIP